MQHCFCWCSWYFNQSSETSRADLQLNLRLDVLSVWIKRSDETSWRHSGLFRRPPGCLMTDVPWSRNTPAATDVWRNSRQMLGERALELLINRVSWRTIETRKMEEPSGKLTPVKGEGGSVQNRCKVAKSLHVVRIVFIYWLFMWQQWLAYTQVWWPQSDSFAAGG